MMPRATTLRPWMAALIAVFLLTTLPQPMLAAATPQEATSGKQQAETKKKKKKKDNKKKGDQEQQKSSRQEGSSATSRELVRKVDRRLLAWDTAGAKQMLDAETGEQDAALATLRGRILAQEGHYDEAAARLDEAARIAGSDPEPLIWLGETYLHAERTDQARQAFSRAADRARARVNSDPDDAAALLALGAAQQRLEQLGDSLANLERARELAPDDAMVAYRLGMTRALRQEWQQAVEAFDRAIQLNSQLAYAYYYRGLAADKVNRKDILVNDMDRFLSLAPNAPESERARRILQAAK